MLASTKHETITETLLRELQSARRGVEANIGALEEYSQALRRFTDWVLDGRIPGDPVPACNRAAPPSQTLRADEIDAKISWGHEKTLGGAAEKF